MNQSLNRSLAPHLTFFLSSANAAITMLDLLESTNVFVPKGNNLIFWTASNVVAKTGVTSVVKELTMTSQSAIVAGDYCSVRHHVGTQDSQRKIGGLLSRSRASAIASVEPTWLSSELIDLWVCLAYRALPLLILERQPTEAGKV